MGGRLSVRAAVRLILLAAAGIGLLLFTVWLNRVDKVPLISREGQTFEKAVVTQIIQDNMTETGTRVGEQVVEVKILTGEKKGELLEVTSSAGFLFGAPCTPGMRVIVMQSVAGDTTIASVYSQDREWVIYLFGILYLVVLVLVGGKQGVKGGIGLLFTFFSILLCLSGIPGIFPVLVGGVHLYHYDAGNHAFNRRLYEKDGRRHHRNRGRRAHGGNFRDAFQLCVGNYRI